MPVIGQISVGDGATFTPSVSNAGVLSWTNNKNLPNPASVDIAQAIIDAGTLAPTASPTFTGAPTAPTPTAGDDSTNIATTAFVQAELADYLALTGGTMTGTINVDIPVEFTDVLTFGTTGHSITYRKTSENRDGILYISMNHDGHWPPYGAQFELNAGNGSGGDWSLRASDGTNSKELAGKSDGSLLWNGIDIGISEKGTGYIRYNNGIQICWGSNSGNTIPQWVNYGASFNALPSIGIQSGDYSASNWANNRFQLIMSTGHTAPSTVYFKYIAIGTWK